MLGETIDKLNKDKGEKRNINDQAAITHVTDVLFIQAGAVRTQSRTDLTAYRESLTQLEKALDPKQIDSFKTSAERYQTKYSALSRRTQSILTQLQQEERRRAISDDAFSLDEDAYTEHNGKLSDEHIRKRSKQIAMLENLQEALIQSRDQLFNQIGITLSPNQYFKKLDDLTDKLDELLVQLPETPQVNAGEGKKIIFESQLESYLKSVTEFLAKVPPPSA